MDDLLARTAERIFADHAETPDALWSALEENGLARAWTPEALGGFGATVEDGFGLMRAAGAGAAPVPLAETLLAGWLLSAAGLETPEGKLSLASGGKVENGRFSGALPAVPFGAEADHITCLAAGEDGPAVVLVQGTGGDSAPTVGEDPIADLAFDEAAPVATAPAPDWLTKDALEQICALARAAQICGAMEAALDLTLAHAAEREQFGRPLAKFQAIQHLLADMAGQTAAAAAAVEAAAAMASLDAPPDLRAVAAAKTRAGEAAGIVAANAHQVHGAIGYTDEYRLARYTRRLWRWRDDYGDETAWAIRLGRLVAEDDASLRQQIFGGKHG